MRSPSLLSFLCFRVRCMTASGKGICHQKPSKMQYPPAPSRQLSPKDVHVGVQGMMWAMSVSHAMFDSGRSFSWKNSISWRIVLLILYWNFAWWTRWAALFIAKLMCFTWSFTKQGKEPVLRERQILRNSGDGSASRCLFSDKANAIDAYKCVSKWNTQLAPSARWLNFPVSFCAFPTVKRRRCECHVVLSRSRTSAT